MEFSVASEELLHHLDKIMGPVGNNPLLPILEDLYCQLSENELTMISTDLETTITTTLSVSSSDSGIFTLPAKMLHEIARALTNQPVKFEIGEDDHHIEISSSFGKYNMNGHDAAEFPEIPGPTEADSIVLPSQVLMDGIDKTLFAVSSDEIRKTMTGVFMQIDFDKVTMVATDAHKLVRFEYSGVKSDVTTSFILPKKSLSILQDVIEGEEDTTVEFNKEHAIFTAGSTVLACRLLEGKYPDYKMVIPKKNPNVLLVNRADLLQSLRRLYIFANKTTHQVMFNVTENSLTLTAQDVDMSNAATEQLEAEYKGDDMFISFNAKFLIDMINAQQVETMRIEMDEPHRACLLLPDKNNENEDLLMLIMPVSY